MAEIPHSASPEAAKLSAVRKSEPMLFEAAYIVENHDHGHLSASRYWSTDRRPMSQIVFPLTGGLAY